MRYLKYFYYIIKHKWYVGIECFKRGLFYQGIVHDVSKFLPSEFFPYAEYFYGKGENKEEFEFAWLCHQRRNKHHWEWWIMRQESCASIVFEMPHKIALEMLCDWIGTGKSRGKFSPKNDPYKEVREWYKNNKENILLNIGTQRFIESKILKEESL